MSKSVESPLGTIGLLDSDEEITRKVRRAVTDTDGEMRYDRAAKPGLANLLDLLAAATGRTPDEVAAGYDRYGDLKNDVAAALCDLHRSRAPAAGGAGGRPALRPRRARRRARRTHTRSRRRRTRGPRTPWGCCPQS